MVAPRESAALASRLTIHADRCSSMRSKPFALLMADLSNGNPYSESQFRALKYRPARA
jgi:putative transposase